ncbi:MAG: signal peptidase I [Acidimicrobiales bacterium]
MDNAAPPQASLRSRVDALVEPKAEMPTDRPGSIAAAAFSGFREASTFSVTTVLLLLAWVVAPTVVPGWHSTAVISGSMGPSIERGDIVVLRPASEPPLPVDTVIRYDSDDGAASILHRIVSADLELEAYVTRGDANADHDSGLVPFDAVDGVGTFLIPIMGYPLLWIYGGDYLWLLLLAIAALCIALPGLGFGPDDPDEISADDRAPGPLTALTLGASLEASEALFPPELIARLQRGRSSAR